MKITALDLRRIDKGSVIGTCTLWLPDLNLRIYECLWGRRGENRSEWLMLPRRQWTANDGSVHYARLLKWGDDSTARTFEKAALEAVHRVAEPEAGDG
jgi:hypothetical protein